MGFDIRCRVGRLFESRIRQVANDQEALTLENQVWSVLNMAPEQVVICSDYRELHVLAPEAAERLAQLFAQTNARIIRSGILVGASPTTHLQVGRLVRESGSVTRRTFQQRGALEAWLGEILTPEERSRLTAFLDEVS